MSAPIRQESDVFSSRLVVVVGLVALVVFAVGIGWAVLIQHGDTGTLVNQPTSPVEHSGDGEVGIVYMKPFEEDYAKRAHGRDRRRLEEIGWADQEQGVAFIPIERAMQMLVDRNAQP